MLLYNYLVVFFLVLIKLNNDMDSTYFFNYELKSYLKILWKCIR